MPKVEVTFTNETEVSVDSSKLIAACQQIISRLRPEEGIDTVNTEVILVGDKKIQSLNKQFLGKDSATDVLSFPNEKLSEVEPDSIGSIVISVDTATKQARDGGVELITELESLVGHGLLHLLGYHHQ